ncbi:threonine/serine exporter family protein [Lentilactobacillus buchneri]|nr:threonine/serine exporter family protein [Lentilactobacillus sp. Egmn17]
MADTATRQENYDHLVLNTCVLAGRIMIESGSVGSIDKRAFDMEKVAKVNELSRAYAAKKIDIYEFRDDLVHIDDLVATFPLWLQTLGAGLVSGTLVVVFQNNLPDFWITFIVGMFGWAVYYFLNIYIQIRFLSEFLAAVVVGALALIAVKNGIGVKADDIIIGGMMPLVPGIPLTNAVRDALSGNLISGPARGIEALISACALGFGVAIALHFF